MESSFSASLNILLASSSWRDRGSLWKLPVTEYLNGTIFPLCFSTQCSHKLEFFFRIRADWCWLHRTLPHCPVSPCITVLSPINSHSVHSTWYPTDSRWHCFPPDSHITQGYLQDWPGSTSDLCNDLFRDFPPVSMTLTFIS